MHDVMSHDTARGNLTSSWRDQVEKQWLKEEEGRICR